jgi:hypothetical protein
MGLNSTHYAPNDKRSLHNMLEAEYGQPQVGEHACFWKSQYLCLCFKLIRIKEKLTSHEGNCTECLLHSDLTDRREVQVSVMGHHNCSDEDGHNPCKKLV